LGLHNPYTLIKQMSGEGYSSSMSPRFIFFIIAVLTLTLSPEIPATSASVAKIQIQAITDSKPGEVEVTFLSQGPKSPKSLITSYQIVAKPVGASGLVFSKNYSKRVSGYMKQKVSPLSPGVDYIFTLTQRSTCHLEMSSIRCVSGQEVLLAML
jgi:hypothetical protein